MSRNSASFVSRPGSWLVHLLTSQCRHAEADLRRFPEAPSAAVHALRVRMKELRALLCFARDQLPETTWKRLCRRIRGIKNVFGGSRDAEVMQALAVKISRRDKLPQPELKLSPSAVASNRRAPLRAARRQLKVLRAELAQLRLQKLTHGCLVAVYARCQQSCRRGMKKCAADLRPKRMHRWRKHVKKWYFLSLALQSLPHAQRSIRPAQKLGRWLGRMHDLDILDAHVSGPAAVKWHAAIARRMKKRERRIFAKAEKVLTLPKRRLLRLLEKEMQAHVERKRDP